MLLPTHFLASRPGQYAAAVIPAEDLASRTHELGPPSREILVLDSDLLPPLERLGRTALFIESAPPAKDDAFYRLWEPNPWLIENLHRNPGAALDLGCGTGRDAVFLADLGWQVSAVDRLPDALERAESLRQRYAPATNVDWQLADLRTFQPTATYDLILGLMSPVASRIPEIKSWLRPGGRLIIELFHPDNRAQNGKPASDDMLLNGEPIRSGEKILTRARFDA